MKPRKLLPFALISFSLTSSVSGQWGRPSPTIQTKPDLTPRPDLGPARSDRNEILKGSIAFKVRPKSASVYVDKICYGSADDFDGYPGYLRLERGHYEITLVKKDFKTLIRKIDVVPGIVTILKDRMESGESQLPDFGIACCLEGTKCCEGQKKCESKAGEEAFAKSAYR